MGWIIKYYNGTGQDQNNPDSTRIFRTITIPKIVKTRLIKMNNKIINQIIITLIFLVTLFLSSYVLYLDYKTTKLGRKIEVTVVKKYCDVSRNKNLDVKFKQKIYGISISSDNCYNLKVGSKLSYYHNTKFDYLFDDWEDNLFWIYFVIGFFIIFTCVNLSTNYPNNKIRYKVKK